jgi:uncharacterized membrane protein YkvA (DUF1232 family)
MGLLESLRAWARRIKRDAMTLWFALRDPRTPWLAKALGVVVVAYALSPIDLIPDFIPVLGLLDELILLPLLLWLALRQLPPEVLDDCRRQAEAWAARSAARPRSRLGAALVVMVWLALALALLWWLVPR